MEFSANDLIWTKNVTRDKGNAWAYSEYQLGDTFFLNFSLGHNNMGIASAKKPNINELILLVQSVYKRELGKPGTYISHIVAPVDDEVIIDNEGTHPVKRLVTVVARDNAMKPKPLYLDFREPNRGWTCDLDLIKPKKNSGLTMTLQEKQILFWNSFQNKDLAVKSVIDRTENPNIDTSLEALEGEEKYIMRRHKYYERDPSLILAKKKDAELNGVVQCEVCSFNFAKLYGAHGYGFVECHHKYPIAKHGKRITRMEDLALVCANCHRMLHRKNEANDYYTVQQLQLLISDRIERCNGS